MTRKLLLIVCILVVGGCSPATHIQTPALTSTEVYATNTAVASNMPKNITYPPCAATQIAQSPMPTASTPNSPPQKLSDGVTLEEYQSYLTQINAQSGGCEYASRRLDQKTIDLNSFYRIEIQPLDINSELVRVVEDGQGVFDVKTLTYGSSGLLQAWSSGDNWILEVKTDAGIDIIEDGQSLKRANGYDKVFAFQFLGGKPFYFFKRNRTWGINYNSHEIQLDYDDIPYTNVSDGMDPSILQYQNMVLFHATKGSQNFSVVISVHP